MHEFGRFTIKTERDMIIELKPSLKHLIHYQIKYLKWGTVKEMFMAPAE